LATKGVNLMEILTSDDPKIFDNILNSFVGIAAVQIGITDLLKSINLHPDYIIGHSVGELGCAYADGCFTAEQMILSSYSRGLASIETKTVYGSMAAIGLGYKKIRTMLPPGIEVACHNGPDSCTISGPAENVAEFVTKLKSQGVFAKEVPCSNIPYHSSYISEMGPKLLSYLNDVIKGPVQRSSKWLSSSVPKSQWERPEAQYSSAFYHTNNLLSPVLFEETSTLLPKDAITIEVAPHGLLQAILKKSMPNAVHIGLTQRGNKANDQFFLSSLGKIYMHGVDLAIENLYPPVEFPVSRGTPMISSLIKWDHSEDWYVPRFEVQRKSESGERKVKLSLSDPEYEFIVGHTIDGRVLFPATAYLYLAWETLGMMNGQFYFDISVEFEDIKFLRATTFAKDVEIEFTIMIQPGTGRFEISEGNTAVVTGFIRRIESPTLTEIKVKEQTDLPMLPTKDFYKELRLRGYHYSGLFRSVVEARCDGLTGKVKWDSNWVAFLDCLLQIQILGKDTRSLCLPTGIQKLVIDPQAHTKLIEFVIGYNTENILEVAIDNNLNILRCGGIEIVNLTANVVGRRKPPGIPVLEKYQFVPNFGTTRYSTSDGMRICVQMALENIPATKVKAVEVDTESLEPIIGYMQDALADLPLVTSELMVLTKQNVQLKGVHVEDGKLSTQSNCLFVIAAGILTDESFLTNTTKTLMDSAFIISREKTTISRENLKLPQNFELIACINVEKESLCMLQYIKKKTILNEIEIEVSENDLNYNWLELLKADIKSGIVTLYSQNEKLSGLIGLTNCIRKEPDGQLVRCVFIEDTSAPAFSTERSFYKSHLKLGLAINIYKNGQWGTYRHLQLTQDIQIKPTSEHCYVNALVKSDLSSLKWIEGQYNCSRPAGELIKIQYASLNFRDVMLATGKLSADVVAESRLEHECVLGFEFSGVSQTGRRVMGMTVTAAMATHVEIDDVFTFDCPDSWTLAEAATVPAVYGTVYSAFFISTKIEKGKSILIHAGSGGVGLAAIRVAFAYGLEVFTTVSTEEKKQYLLSQFPNLKSENIGNSRDISFEKMVLQRTNGCGVDYVLNSLSEDKLQASLRCLGKGGKFLEIGKFDMANDTKIGMGHFLKELSFHSIMVDKLFKAPREEKMKMRVLIEKDLKTGVIVPLKTNVFPAAEVEQAFRFLASGKHIGKVLLQVREQEQDLYTLPIQVVPRVYCSPEMSYIIPGGLGGFGMELADWLIIRGCRKIVLNSTRGISKAYQAYRIKIWESYGVKVLVNTFDITTKIGCEQLISQASSLGPVGGIFNLAVALRDSILDNQDSIKFKECMGPKALATKHLDEVSRKLCPYLRYFVIFSSVSCGRGNAGQMNYGMANSVMERIMEQRYKDGLPAKAIQWGAVGEVGIVADMQEDKLDMEIGGTLQQRISSCLEELDPLMSSDDPIVSSMVVAEKRSSGTKGLGIIETVMHIMSIKDIRSVSMDTTLSEMGMDSLMAVEIRQALERDFELFLSPQELRSLTFLKLKEFSDAKQSTDDTTKLKLASENTPVGLKMLLRNLGDEQNCGQTVMRLKTLDNSDTYRTCALIIPGVEGVAGAAWHNMAENLDIPAYILQSSISSNATTVEEIVDEVFMDVLRLFKPLNHFFLVGYSFGSLIAIELAKRLENENKRGQLVLIDGSPAFLKKLALEQISQNVDDVLDVIYLNGVVDLIFPDQNAEIIKKMMSLPTFEDRMELIVTYAKDATNYSSSYFRNMLQVVYSRIKLVINLDLNNVPKIESPIALIRPTQVSFANIDEDYEMREKTVGEFSLKFVEGTHITMLENVNLPAFINSFSPTLRDNKTFKDTVLNTSSNVVIE
jgi:fatty acid synthase